MTRDREGDLVEGKTCAPSKCATTEKRQRASTPRRK